LEMLGQAETKVSLMLTGKVGEHWHWKSSAGRAQ